MRRVLTATGTKVHLSVDAKFIRVDEPGNSLPENTHRCVGRTLCAPAKVFGRTVGTVAVILDGWNEDGNHAAVDCSRCRAQGHREIDALQHVMDGVW